jgi:hypothetical protein
LRLAAQAEADRSGLARSASDGDGAGLGGRLVGAAGAVQDGAELGQELGEADLAGVRKRGEQPCLGVLGKVSFDRPLEAYLRDHDVPPDAEVRLGRAGAADAGGIRLAWDPRALVLVLDEADPG